MGRTWKCSTSNVHTCLDEFLTCSIMGDDAANGWGTTLCLEWKTTKRGNKSCGDSAAWETKVSGVLRSSCAPFVYNKVVANGSDANALALCMVTGMSNNGALLLPVVMLLEMAV